MTDYQSYSKKLCMTELQTQRFRFCNNHYFDAGSGKVNSSFGFIIQGSVTLKSMGKRIEIPECGLFYVPEGIRYNSVWSGNPDVEFISLHIISRRPDTSTAQRYAMAHIPELSNTETRERITEIYNLFATGTRVNMVRAIGLYYAFYADVLPFLQPEPPVRLNPVLTEATRYIEENYNADFSVDELAAHCCVSESRLYHIFRCELGTTPVKYRNELRVENAAAVLRSGEMPLEDVAESCGFNSVTYFREIFRDFTGLTPVEYRNLVGVHT